MKVTREVKRRTDFVMPITEFLEKCAIVVAGDTVVFAAGDGEGSTTVHLGDVREVRIVRTRTETENDADGDL